MHRGEPMTPRRYLANTYPMICEAANTSPAVRAAADKRSLDLDRECLLAQGPSLSRAPCHASLVPWVYGEHRANVDVLPEERGVAR